MACFLLEKVIFLKLICISAGVKVLANNGSVTYLHNNIQVTQSTEYVVVFVSMQ